MKVISCLAPRKLAVQETPAPKIKQDQVLVKVNYCGICVYDLKRYLGKKKITYPVILGHEPSGVIEKIGEDIRDLNTGDRVLVNVKVTCGTCSSCLAGLESRCQDAEASNGFSQFLALPEKNVIRVLDDFDLVVGTLAEPLACCIHAYDKIKTMNSSTVLVVGDGIMGMLTAFLGKSVKTAAVTVAGHHNDRLSRAESIKVDCVLNTKKSVAGLEKYHTIFLTVEDRNIVRDIENFLYPGGSLVFMGELSDGPYSLNLNKIYSNEFNFTGSKGYTSVDFAYSAELISEHSNPLKTLISKIYAFSELETGLLQLQKRKILKGVLNLR